MKLLGVLLLIPCIIMAQPQFFGYFESEVDMLQMGSENYAFGYNKFRLDVEARPSDNVLIGANINAQHYWGKTSWNVFDFIPGNDNPGAVLNFELPDTILLDNVYMRLRFSKLDITLGRQQISPGVGYAWNPTDIFNSKSLLDPSYEQTGVTALRIDIPLLERSTLSAVLSPEENWKTSARQLWLKYGVGRFDLSVTAAAYQWETLRSLLYGYGPIDQRSLLGGSIVGELLGWGVWSEYGHNEVEYRGAVPATVDAYLEKPEGPFDEFVVGTDHTFDNSLYVLFEYLHNENGVKNKADLTFLDYSRSLEGTSESLMQDYGFLYLMHPTFDFVSLSALVIANFNDNSGTLAPQLDWDVFQNTNISLQSSISWGAEDTEFGLQDWGLRLRVRSNF